MAEICSEKTIRGDDDVVVVLSVSIYDRKTYEGMNVAKITPSKVVDDWGVTLGESYPMVFVGKKMDIEQKLESHIQNEWSAYDSKKRSKRNGLD